MIKIIIGTSVCDNNHSLTINTNSGDGAKGKLCAINLRVASSIPAEQLPMFFHNVFSFLTKPQSFHPSYGLL